jgi:TatD DNase family protein
VKLIDTHAHLNDGRLLPQAESIAAAMDADGLSRIINVAWDVASAETAVNLAGHFEPFYAVVGIHPHEAKNADRQAYDKLISLAGHPKTLAYGEIGLDFFYDLSERDVQKRVFIEQLEIAHGLKLPVVVHLRDAYGEMLSILKEKRSDLAYGLVLHCYSGSEEMVREFSRFDAYFSFGGAITFKNANKEPVLRAVPADRLMLETDCPYMTPVPYRGQTNYPRYIALVAEKLQSMFPERDIAALTTENARRFFRIHDNLQDK